MSTFLNTLFMVLAVVLDYVQKGLVMLFSLRMPVKGNLEDGKKVYYVPSHPKYKEVEVSVLKGEKYFLDEAAALKDGWIEASK